MRFVACRSLKSIEANPLSAQEINLILIDRWPNRDLKPGPDVQAATVTTGLQRQTRGGPKFVKYLDHVTLTTLFLA